MDKLALVFWAALDTVAANLALLEARNYVVSGGTPETTANWSVFGVGYVFLALVFGVWFSVNRSGIRWGLWKAPR